MADTDTPTWAQVTPYFKGSGTPVCRDQGTYAINVLTSNPTCTRNGTPYSHVMATDVSGG
jgi:hypothetical protein